MRILTVLLDLGYRGTQRAAQNYSIALADRGHDVAVLAINEGGDREASLRERGIRTWIGGDNLDSVLEEVRRFNPEIIHCHRAGLSAPVWDRVITVLKTATNRVLETNVFGRVDYSETASLIDLHLHISRWCLYRWNRWRGRRQQNGVYLPYGVDTAAFPEMGTVERETARLSFHLPQSSFICGRIGKWTPVIFRAFAELIDQCPDALLLNVADHADAEAFIARLPERVQRRIVKIPRLGSDAELVRFYAAIDCLLQVAPGGESFGMVLAEAMACGTPVITASLPHKDNAQCEVVRHGEGGVVAGSASKLPAALAAFYGDRQLRRRCSSHARMLITDRYALGEVAGRIEALALHALASSSRDDLARRLRADSGFETDIEPREIHRSLHDTFGGPRMMDVALMHLVHNPIVYRRYSTLMYGA